MPLVQLGLFLLTENPLSLFDLVARLARMRSQGQLSL